MVEDDLEEFLNLAEGADSPDQKSEFQFSEINAKIISLSYNLMKQLEGKSNKGLYQTTNPSLYQPNAMRIGVILLSNV